jgi:hypothetical protein
MSQVNMNQIFSNIVTFSKKVNYNGIPEFLDKLVENGKLIASMLYDFIIMNTQRFLGKRYWHY